LRDRQALDRQLPHLAARIASVVRGRVLLLGTEELMYVPLRLAGAMAGLGTDIRSSSTTRSPAVAVDDPGYPLRTRLVFATADGERYAYNVAPGRDPSRRFDTIVVVTDAVGDGLLDALSAHCDSVVVVPIPSYVPGPLPSPLRGPAFGSYPGDEVSWLLTDLSDVELEAPTEEREEAVQSGGAHYAESLPVEYVPSAAYDALFADALASSADRVATAVGVVTELVLAGRARPVLASLARAGVPVGILMRRWANWRHGLDLAHHAVSIVRGRGVDTVALRWLAAHHDPADVVFVDGWTGKGAIVTELAAALREHSVATGQSFRPDLAVLADPGHCVRTFGTRDDFLIPSACLNSTVSGLVSRTVLNDDLIGPGDFHGAKFYPELAGADVSATFLDAICARFAAVRPDVEGVLAARAGQEVEPDWSGWAAIERISTEYGIDSVNLVKPGVGETTRVLLRRVPWRILARTGAGADLAHVRLLAAERGVPVEDVDGLPYTCVGLIHPRYSRGASGADGLSASGADGLSAG
ncbi:MAG: TRSP domain-containing protein, partial [Geodermatophilaceae bacterium]|nr:TRSP domain-containing protein [Geodermatophilaceae bacterium]